MKKTIVISGINMIDGGALSIIKECLKYLDSSLSSEYKIIALVHDKELFALEELKNIEFKEFKDSKSSWLNRVRYEYFCFPVLSKELNPYLWLSLHDITPNVQANIKAVYCHNPAPFYRPSFTTLHLEPKLLLFRGLYKYLYKVNIHKNDFVVVQQNWLKQEFKKMFSLKNVVVAHPEITIVKDTKNIDEEQQRNTETIFFYPSFPRVFKNFEVVFEASRHLQLQGINNFKIKVTLAGNENKYASYLFNKYKDDPNIEWCGLMSRKEVFENYSKADSLVFSSKLETWGLPITEFREFSKPMLLANLPYARETAAGYPLSKYFNANDFKTLSHLMKGVLKKSMTFDTQSEDSVEYKAQAKGWKELFDILLSKNDKSI